MSKNIAVVALGAILALGVSTQTFADTSTNTGSMKMQQETKSKIMKEMHSGHFEKCYGIVKSGQNDCAAGTIACAGQAKMDGAKNAWIGLPPGTCSRIVGGSTTPEG